MSDVDLADIWREGRERLHASLGPKGELIEVPMRMSKTFARLTASERAQIVPLLREWLLSGDDGERYDALIVIEDNAVIELVPDLRILQSRAEASDDVSAPFDWSRVNRALGRVVEGWRREW